MRSDSSSGPPSLDPCRVAHLGSRQPMPQGGHPCPALSKPDPGRRRVRGPAHSADEPPEPFKGMQYRLVGPWRGGRALAAVGTTGDANTYYAGYTGGGVWKTTNGGGSWKSLFDKEAVSSIGAIAVAASDPSVVYVGTGEACIRGNLSHGDGVYKSTDAGKTWTNVGLKDTRHIGALLVHPKDPDLVYVAALGHVYGAERGARRLPLEGRREDLGEGPLPDEKTGAVDLAMDPREPEHPVRGAAGEANRKPWSLTSGGPGSGLYRSADGGAPGRSRGEGLARRRRSGKIGVSVSGGDSRARLRDGGGRGREGGLYRSNDGGGEWKHVTDEHRLRQRAWYYTHVACRPAGAGHALRAQRGPLPLARRRQDLDADRDAPTATPRHVDRPRRPEADGRGQRRRGHDQRGRGRDVEPAGQPARPPSSTT